MPNRESMLTFPHTTHTRARSAGRIWSASVTKRGEYRQLILRGKNGDTWGGERRRRRKREGGRGNDDEREEGGVGRRRGKGEGEEEKEREHEE